MFSAFNYEEDQYLACLVQNRNWSYDSQSADMEIMSVTDVCSVHIKTIGKCEEVHESEAK